MNSPSTVCDTRPQSTSDYCGQSAIKKVLFVCTGNTCRSPMAAAWLNHYGKEAGIYACSAGIFPVPGQRISPNAVSALNKAGIPAAADNRYDLHEAVRITSEMIETCDMVIGISRSHAMNLICEFPAYASKISNMPVDIPDPYAGTPEDYDACLSLIADAIKELFRLDV